MACCVSPSFCALIVVAIFMVDEMANKDGRQDRANARYAGCKGPVKELRSTMQ